MASGETDLHFLAHRPGPGPINAPARAAGVLPVSDWADDFTAHLASPPFCADADQMLQIARVLSRLQCPAPSSGRLSSRLHDPPLDGC